MRAVEGTQKVWAAARGGKHTGAGALVPGGKRIEQNLVQHRVEKTGKLSRKCRQKEINEICIKTRQTFVATEPGSRDGTCRKRPLREFSHVTVFKRSL